MQKVTVELISEGARCPELGLAVQYNDPKTAVELLLTLIPQGYHIVLPYLGPGFRPDWHTIDRRGSWPDAFERELAWGPGWREQS